jgi:Family of unknown function (DUF6174)
MTDATNPTPPPPTPKKKNHAWIGFFAFLIVASVGVTAFMIWYNLSIQLKPEQLEAARKLWQETGPKSYNLVYTERHNEEKTNTFAVKVRDGKVDEVLMNGRPLEKTEEQKDDPRIYHSMDAQFRMIENFMKLDQKPDAPRVYVTAIFDEKNGAVLRYIRRVMGTTKRVEMHFTLDAVVK